MSTNASCARRRRSSADGGATSVEFALLFPIFLVICFGTVSFGILFSDKLAITQGAREAARYGATLPYKTVTPTQFLTDVRDAALTSDAGELGTGSPAYCVHIKKTDGSFVRLEAADTAAEAGACVTTGLPVTPHVHVSVTKPASLNMLLYSFTLDIGSTSVARYEATT